MEQFDQKTLALLVALISLVGVVIGGSITIVGNLLVKRQERLAQISKLIAEKRFDAYEEVITTVRFASLGVGDLNDQEYLKYPLILQDRHSYLKWSAEYTIICRRASHLIDAELERKLWVLRNYLIHLEDALVRLADADGHYADPERAMIFGTIVYSDFQRLTSDILEAAGRFFSEAIFRSQFTPATMSYKGCKLPKDFSKLALFSRSEEIDQLLNH